MNKKIVVIGAGNVGSHIVFSAINKKIKADFILVDKCDSFEEGQVLDLKDSLSFSQYTKVETGDLSDEKVRKSDIFIITAGVKQKEGEDRLSLLNRNIKILEDIKKEIGKIKKTAIVILVSNPVDILAQKAIKIFDLPKNQVFGSGTILDTSRLKWRLSEVVDKNGKNIFNKNPEKIKAYVFGEHGDSSFIAWSLIKNSDKIKAKQKEEIEKKVRQEAYKIISEKGATFFGIGSAVTKIIENIIEEKKEELMISAPLDGQYGQENISIGVPVILSKKGIEKIIIKKINQKEKSKFNISIKKMKEFL